MSLPAYAEYKDSGVEWLGDVPKHWTVKKLGYLGEAIIGLTYSPDDVVNEGTLVLRSSNVQNGKIFLEDNVFVNKAINEKLLVKNGDILICSRNGSRDLIGKNAMIGNESKGATFGAFMTIFRSNINDYIYCILNSHIFSAQSGSFMTSTVNQLTTGNLNSFLIPLPSRPEQTTIARFLDHETAKIDALIAEQQRLIELLKEKRQAVISHAVTKGLDPNAPMKDSGVAWLGDVPEHWVVTKIKNACYINDGNHGEEYPTADDFTESEEGVPFIRAGNIKNMKIDGNEMLYIKKSKNDSMRKGRLKEGDVLFTNRGEIGKVATVSREFSGSNLNSQIAYLRASNNVLDGGFLAYFLGSDTIFCSFDSNSAGSVLTQFPIKDIERLPLVLPSVNEQIQVSKFLDQQTAKIDELISHAHQGIDLLKERRSALISAAVTGKIDVRGWQPPATAATTPQGQQQTLFDD